MFRALLLGLFVAESLGVRQLRARDPEAAPAGELRHGENVTDPGENPDTSEYVKENVKKYEDKGDYPEQSDYHHPDEKYEQEADLSDPLPGAPKYVHPWKKRGFWDTKQVPEPWTGKNHGLFNGEHPE